MQSFKKYTVNLFWRVFCPYRDVLFEENEFLERIEAELSQDVICNGCCFVQLTSFGGFFAPTETFFSKKMNSWKGLKPSSARTSYVTVVVSWCFSSNARLLVLFMV